MTGNGIRKHLRNAAKRVAEACFRKGLPRRGCFSSRGQVYCSLIGRHAFTVGTVKALPNGILIAAVDGGMSDNPGRPCTG